MLEDLPTYVSVVFGLTTFLSLFLFYWVIKSSHSRATRNISNVILLGLLVWLAVQAALTLNNVYNSDTTSLPPKVVLFGVLPAILAIIMLFVTQGGRTFIDSLPLAGITYLHIVRIPVEVVLWWLFLHKAVPQLMTFEGRNFDILAGITAPFIAYFGVAKGKLNRKVVLAWNVICLGLLANIVVNALLSAQSPLQRFAFDQPNIAITNFPFSWLPSFVVPVVLFAHLAAIRQLTKRNAKEA